MGIDEEKKGNDVDFLFSNDEESKYMFWKWKKHIILFVLNWEKDFQNIYKLI